MMNTKVWQWCRNFEAECTDVHDAGGQGMKRVSTDDLVQRVDHTIQGNRQFKISVLSDAFVNERLQYCKLCAIWSPDVLQPSQDTVNGQHLYIFPTLPK